LHLFHKNSLLNFLFKVFSSFFALFLRNFSFKFLSMDFIESFKMSLFKRQFILFELLQVYSIAFRWYLLLVFCYYLRFKIQSESLFQLEIIKAQCLWSVYLYLLNLLAIHNVNGIVRKSAWQKYGESVLLQPQV